MTLDDFLHYTSQSNINQEGASSDPNKAAATINGQINSKTQQKETFIDKQYASNHGRLVDFEYNDGTLDKYNRAYLHLEGDTTSVDFKESIPSENREAFEAILSDLTGDSGYKAFILLNIAENRQEKQHVVTTIGDAFASTFSGQEPQVLDIIGMLPMDYSNVSSSWYLTFINAYKYLFRASILAKYNLQLKLILRGYCEYTLYPVNFGCNLQASQDNLINFHMSALVVEDKLDHAYGLAPSANIPATVVDDVAEAARKQVIAAQKGEDIPAGDVGKNSNKKSFLETADSFLKSLTSGQATSEAAKVTNTILKVYSATGAVSSATGIDIGKRTGVGKVFSALGLGGK